MLCMGLFRIGPDLRRNRWWFSMRGMLCRFIRGQRKKSLVSIYRIWIFRSSLFLVLCKQSMRLLLSFIEFFLLLAILWVKPLHFLDLFLFANHIFQAHLPEDIGSPSRLLNLLSRSYHQTGHRWCLRIFMRISSFPDQM